jgi:hypothetical protein
MSLNVDWSKIPQHLKLFKCWNEDGTPVMEANEETGAMEQKTLLHPKIERLMWLTISINRDLTGGAKAKLEFKMRLHTLQMLGLCSAMEIGTVAYEKEPETWKGAKLVAEGTPYARYTYELTSDDVEAYWGLKTNVWGREAFSKWLVRLTKLQLSREYNLPCHPRR